jgi:hypothetical protein
MTDHLKKIRRHSDLSETAYTACLMPFGLLAFPYIVTDGNTGTEG